MIKLMHGNCLELLKKIESGSIDMILTDPPYGTTQCKWDTIIPFEPMWVELKRVIKPNGAIVLFGSEPFSSLLRVSNLEMFKYDWVWEKDKAANFAISGKQPLKKHENLSVFYKKQPFYNSQGEKLEQPITRVLPKNKIESIGFDGSSNVLNGERKKTTYTHRTKSSLVYFPRDSQYSKAFHPTQKPVALLEYLIETYTNEGETVLDFTMGSGSTGIACVNTNRNFIGIELDRNYFEIAKERINGATPIGDM